MLMKENFKPKQTKEESTFLLLYFLQTHNLKIGFEMFVVLKLYESKARFYIKWN